MSAAATNGPKRDHHKIERIFRSIFPQYPSAQVHDDCRDSLPPVQSLLPLPDKVVDVRLRNFGRAPRIDKKRYATTSARRVRNGKTSARNSTARRSLHWLV